MKKVKIGDRVFDVFNTSIFLIFTLICVFPFYYVFINTISDNSVAAAGKILFYSDRNPLWQLS